MYSNSQHQAQSKIDKLYMATCTGGLASMQEEQVSKQFYILPFMYKKVAYKSCFDTK